MNVKRNESREASLFLNIQATKNPRPFTNHLHDFTFPNSAVMVRPALLPECIKQGFESYYDIRLTGKLASSRPSQRRARPSHACGAQEWRDSQRPPCYLRYVDELNFEGGGTDQPGTALLLSTRTLKTVSSSHTMNIKEQ